MERNYNGWQGVKDYPKNATRNEHEYPAREVGRRETEKFLIIEEETDVFAVLEDGSRIYLFTNRYRSKFKKCPCIGGPLDKQIKACPGEDYTGYNCSERHDDKIPSVIYIHKSLL